MDRTKRFLGWLLLVLMALNVAHAADGQDRISKYRKYSITWLLTAEDPARIKLGAQWLEHDSQVDQDLVDLAALSLWQYTQHERVLNPDTVAWLARALGSSHSRRYQLLLKTLADEYPGKIQRYASDSLAQLSMDAAAFDPAGLSRESIRNDLQQEAQSEVAGEASIADINSGAWIEDVFKKYGYPTEINVISRGRHAPFAPLGVRIYVDNLLLNYGNKGVVEFSYDRGDWYAITITLRPTVSRFEADPDAVVHGLLSTNVGYFRKTAKNAFRAGISDEQTLDVVVDRLFTDLKTSDDQVADGLAYLCSILGNARNPRYHDAISYVSMHAAESKVRKYATAALQKIPIAQVEQYPGQDVPAQTP